VAEQDRDRKRDRNRTKKDKEGRREEARKGKRKSAGQGWGECGQFSNRSCALLKVARTFVQNAMCEGMFTM
jgi:hypothetical protein